MTDKRPILIVDGFNYFIRNFMVNEATNVSGDLVGGVLGFLRGMKILTNQFKPYQIFVVWEQGGASPRRKHIYPEYKANREKTKLFTETYRSDGKYNPMSDQENKTKQLMLLTKALGFLPVCQLYVGDTEADDVIAWLVKNRLKNYEGNKIIVSSDKDFYQLLEDPTVRVFNPATKSFVGEKEVLERFGLSPRNITIGRCLEGDPSDNIEGISGVGLKTVAKRFSELADTTKDFDIDWLMERCKENITNSKKAPKCFQDILTNEAVVRRNWQLMYLDNSSLSASQIAKLNFKIDEYKPAINHLEFLKVFTGSDIPVTKDIDSIPSELRFLVISS